MMFLRLRRYDETGRHLAVGFSGWAARSDLSDAEPIRIVARRLFHRLRYPIRFASASYWARYFSPFV
jgi:hypothetical protein